MCDMWHALFLTSACLARPVLEVAEFWQPEKLSAIAWMFKAEHEKEVKEATKSMITGRMELLSKLPSIKALLVFESQAKKVEKVAWQLVKIRTIMNDVEDLSSVCMNHFNTVTDTCVSYYQWKSEV